MRIVSVRVLQGEINRQANKSIVSSVIFLSKDQTRLCALGKSKNPSVLKATIQDWLHRGCVSQSSFTNLKVLFSYCQTYKHRPEITALLCCSQTALQHIHMTKHLNAYG